MAIYRLLQNLPMGPEEISRMTAAYEQTLRALHLEDRADPITEISPGRSSRSRKPGSKTPRKFRGWQ
jgi:hypothetical protein